MQKIVHCDNDANLVAQTWALLKQSRGSYGNVGHVETCSEPLFMSCV